MALSAWSLSAAANPAAEKNRCLFAQLYTDMYLTRSKL